MKLYVEENWVLPPKIIAQLKSINASKIWYTVLYKSGHLCNALKLSEDKVDYVKLSLIQIAAKGCCTVEDYRFQLCEADYIFYDHLIMNKLKRDTVYESDDFAPDLLRRVEYLLATK